MFVRSIWYLFPLLFLYIKQTWFFLYFLLCWEWPIYFVQGEGGKKASPVLKNNLSGGEKGMSGISRGSFKTKFASLNNGRIKENEGKMSKISVKKAGKSGNKAGNPDYYSVRSPRSPVSKWKFTTAYSYRDYLFQRSSYLAWSSSRR